MQDRSLYSDPISRYRCQGRRCQNGVWLRWLRRMFRYAQCCRLPKGAMRVSGLRFAIPAERENRLAAGHVAHTFCRRGTPFFCGRSDSVRSKGVPPDAPHQAASLLFRQKRCNFSGKGCESIPSTFRFAIFSSQSLPQITEKGQPLETA